MKNRFFKALWGGALAVLLSASVSPAHANWFGGNNCCDPCADDGFGLTFKADYLYWTACQADLLVAQTAITPAVGAGAQRTGHEFKYKYRSGFRLEALWAVPCTDWALEAGWTYFHPSIHNHVAAPTTGVLLPFIPDAIVPVGTTATDAHSHMRLHYDQFDVLAVKSIYGEDCFNWRWYSGFRGIWVRERLFTTYTGADFGTTGGTAKWHLTVPAGGITVGTKVRWDIFDSFFLISRVGASLLAADPRQSQEWVIPTTITATTGTYSQRSRHCDWIAGFDAALGIGYDLHLCNWDILLSASYEVFDWWNFPQRQRGILFQPSSDEGSRLTLHGLTVRAGITF